MTVFGTLRRQQIPEIIYTSYKKTFQELQKYIFYGKYIKMINKAVTFVRGVKISAIFFCREGQFFTQHPTFFSSAHGHT